ncbi:SPFH domain-containing protein [Jiangella mangrovi]|uniref:Regulator of protease activity HflC (Stomatin/prohibitin superfamily) n=1 Tax=Jiangella mangrovi TaxID=1524084 RepID=A0A7W9GPK4_9ACTN|nr:SPFH domain-containing protein [Jiangella mangrovi]MBB5787463.1 regulator of protease activity HflC (stomatin/prohibitin superfamily) [Jiangella mangrovi]
MAEIRGFGLLRHLRSTPTEHVIHQRGDRVVHSGTGCSFWFRPLTAALSEVPVDDRELPVLFHGRTGDFQKVAVQATVTYRFADPALVAGRVDFAIDSRTGRWRAAPLDQVAHLLTETAQQHAADLLVTIPMADALGRGIAAIRDRLRTGLVGDERLRDTGVVVLDVRVVSVRPDPDIEKALQTPARELIQEEADRATYERRAHAVERERTISENELQSKIELAAREENLVAQHGANERRRAAEEAAAARIAAEAEAERAGLAARAAAERTGLAATAEADRIRLTGSAEADAEAARLAVLAELDHWTQLMLALREVAEQLPSIGTLHVTPDLLTTALARLTAATGDGAER